MSPRAIGVDVGGTSIKGVLVESDGRVAAEIRRPTPAPDPFGEVVVATVAEIVGQLASDERMPVGVVVPGIVDEALGVAMLSASIGWADLPLARMLEERLGRRVAFGHDVRAGAIAEATWGAVRGAASGTVGFVPIGTGISAALLIDGRPIVADGWAGEIGQLRITAGPYAGERVESVASAAATARRAGEPDARSVAARVDDGDAIAQAVWDQTVAVLADSLAGLCAVFAPRTIVIGGGLSHAGQTLLTPLAEGLEARLGPLRRPDLRAAALGDRAAAMGASVLARSGR